MSVAVGADPDEATLDAVGFEDAFDDLDRAGEYNIVVEVHDTADARSFLQVSDPDAPARTTAWSWYEVYGEHVDDRDLDEDLRTFAQVLAVYDVPVQFDADSGLDVRLDAPLAEAPAAVAQATALDVGESWSFDGEDYRLSFADGVDTEAVSTSPTWSRARASSTVLSAPGSAPTSRTRATTPR